MNPSRFVVVIRHITGSRKASAAAVKSLEERGFVNYFGHQRFGNSAASMMPSVELGKLMSRGMWKEVRV